MTSADALGAAGIDREHAFHVLVAEIEGFDLRQFLVHRRAGGDLLGVDLLAGLLDRGDRAIEPRLDVELARRGDEQRDEAGVHQRGDALAHLVAGLVEVLADIGEPLVATAGGRVGVVGEHRNAGFQRALRSGESKACGSTIGTAIASALAAMAAFMALTISATSALAEPVHW